MENEERSFVSIDVPKSKIEKMATNFKTFIKKLGVSVLKYININLKVSSIGCGIAAPITLLIPGAEEAAPILGGAGAIAKSGSALVEKGIRSLEEGQKLELNPKEVEDFTKTIVDMKKVTENINDISEDSINLAA